MSPDEQVVVDTIGTATRRARIVAIAEALAWGLATAAFTAVAAPLVAAAILSWRLRTTARPALVRALERTHRDARNLFVTADELSRGLLAAKPAVRERVFARAAAESRRLNLRDLAPLRSVVRAGVIAAAAWVLVSTQSIWRQPVERIARRAGLPIESPAGSANGSIRITVSLTPPRYTGIAASTTADPTQIAAVEGTDAVLSIDATATRVLAEHEGTPRRLTRTSDGSFVDHIELKKTGYYAIETDGGSRRVIPIVVTPDALPAVRVTAPGRDLVYPLADRRVDFEVRATDDYGLRALRLEYTKVSGSGEQFEFQEGQIPLALTRTGDRDWRGTGTQTLRDLNLAEGDVLVYRAVAADARPGDGSGRSDAFFIEISKLVAAAGDAFTVPEEETRFALSQQMLIVKTERLDKSRSTMTPDAVNEASLNLAVEQRMIRAAFVFMLGGEVEDEDVEAAQSSELQAGRLQNRGQRDLRAATVAMSQAERLLTSANTRDGLTAERAAVTALQRAFARDRYILRAPGSRTELDMKRRLTGTLADAIGGRRDRPARTPNKRAALLQDLLAGIGALKTSVASGFSSADASAKAVSRTSTGRDAAILAREALRIDAGSTVLRTAAEDLQKLADTWSSTPASVRASAIDTVAAAVAAETALALSGPQIPPVYTSPALAGGFAEALRGGSK